MNDPEEQKGANQEGSEAESTNEDWETLTSSSAEDDDDRHSTYSVERAFYPDAEFVENPDYYKPYVDEAFGDKLQNLHDIDNLQDRIIALIDLVRPNFVIGPFAPEQKKILRDQLEPLFNELTSDHMKTLPTSALGRLFHLRNVFAFDKPSDEIFIANGILDPERERWVIERIQTYVNLVKNNTTLMQDLRLDRATLNDQQKWLLWGRLVAHGATAFEVDQRLQFEIEDATPGVAHAGASTTRTFPSILAVTNAGIMQSDTDLVSTGGHEIVHARQNQDAAKFASSEITPIYSPGALFSPIIAYIGSTVSTWFTFGTPEPSWNQPDDLHPHELYAANINAIRSSEYKASAYLRKTAQYEKYGYAAQIATSIFLEQSLEFNPDQRGILRLVDPYKSRGDLRQYVAIQFENAMGCPLWKIVTRNHFVKAQNDEPEVPAETAVTALWKFKDLQKECLSHQSIVDAMLSRMPEILRHGYDEPSPLRAQFGLIIEVLRAPNDIDIKEHLQKYLKTSYDVDLSTWKSVDFNRASLAEMRNDPGMSDLSSLMVGFLDDVTREILYQVACNATKQELSDECKKNFREIICNAPRYRPADMRALESQAESLISRTNSNSIATTPIVKAHLAKDDFLAPFHMREQSTLGFFEVTDKDGNPKSPPRIIEFQTEQHYREYLNSTSEEIREALTQAKAGKPPRPLPCNLDAATRNELPESVEPSPNLVHLQELKEQWLEQPERRAAIDKQMDALLQEQQREFYATVWPDMPLPLRLWNDETLEMVRSEAKAQEPPAVQASNQAIDAAIPALRRLNGNVVHDLMDEYDDLTQQIEELKQRRGESGFLGQLIRRGQSNKAIDDLRNRQLELGKEINEAVNRMKKLDQITQERTLEEQQQKRAQQIKELDYVIENVESELRLAESSAEYAQDALQDGSKVWRQALQGADDPETKSLIRALERFRQLETLDEIDAAQSRQKNVQQFQGTEPEEEELQSRKLSEARERVVEYAKLRIAELTRLKDEWSQTRSEIMALAPEQNGKSKATTDAVERPGSSAEVETETESVCVSWENLAEDIRGGLYKDALEMLGDSPLKKFLHSDFTPQREDKVGDRRLIRGHVLNNGVAGSKVPGMGLMLITAGHKDVPLVMITRPDALKVIQQNELKELQQGERISGNITGGQLEGVKTRPMSQAEAKARGAAAKR